VKSVKKLATAEGVPQSGKIWSNMWS